MSENIELTHSTTLQNEQMTQPNSSEQTSPLDAGDQQTLIHSRILIIDSESLVADGLKDYLQASGFNNVAAVCSDEAIQDVLINEKADVVLLDRMAANGLDILSAMRVDKAYKHTPVIVLTTVIDSATKLKALELGATEFLTKPVNINELALRLRNILRDKFYHDCLAFVDPVTGLPNRERHLHVLDSALRFAKRYGVIGAELHINIARFQQISDALGTTVSDELLREVAKRLQTCIRDTDSIAVDEGHGTSKILSRPGGDDFNIMLPIIAGPDRAGDVAQRIIDALKAPFVIDEHELYVGCNVGISVFPNDGTITSNILKYASTALHYAKQAGQNQYQFYSKELNTTSRNRLKLESELRKAIENNELRLYYQPKIDIKTNRLCAAEALLRWIHPQRGFVSPVEFIPVAEESGLIIRLGDWVIKEGCRQLKEWLAQGLMVPRVSINVSSLQFRQLNFTQMIQDVLTEAKVDTRYLCIELTESAIMDSALENISKLNRLKEIGVELSIDDFGTGYSSLSYLKRFPLDELKIDRSFLVEVDTDPHNAAIAIAIIGLAQNLGLRVVAEGVETLEQLNFLREQNCDDCQGYLFGKPMPANEFGSLLQHSSFPELQPG